MTGATGIHHVENTEELVAGFESVLVEARSGGLPFVDFTVGMGPGPGVFLLGERNSAHPFHTILFFFV